MIHNFGHFQCSKRNLRIIFFLKKHLRVIRPKSKKHNEISASPPSALEEQKENPLSNTERDFFEPRLGSDFKYTITSTQGNIIKVGTTVTYDFNGNIPEGSDFTWVIENDPNTYTAFLKDNPDLLQRYTRNANKRKMQAIARIPGTHTIRVDITKGSQYISSAIYKQSV